MTLTSPMHDLIETARTLAPTIRATAGETERLGTLAPAVLEKLRDARLFDLVLPRTFGGLEVDIITMMRVIEEVAIADGATGWCVGIGVGTSIVSAFLRDDVARQIFRPGVITGGPVAPLGRLTPAEGGFRLTGRWPFASGSPHCEWLIGGALVFEGDAPRIVNGAPDWRLAVMPRADVEILDTWHVSGLRGTGSNDIAAKNIFVPEDRTVPFLTSGPVQPGPLYHFPMIGFLALTIAPVATGIARRAIDELVDLARKKVPTGRGTTLRERPVAQQEIAKAEAEVRAGRAFLYEAAGDAWNTLSAGGRLTAEQRASVRLACAHATVCAKRAVEAAYQLGGGSALYETSVLQRQLRDIFAATQHIVLAETNYETAGQVIMGLDISPLTL
ncbi:MAG: acyl-CoA dehydrogenase family protein [Dehalococcoidia bacterium]